MPTLPEHLARRYAQLLINAVNQDPDERRYEYWYAGITNDLTRRLSDHGFSVDHPTVHACETPNRVVAAEAERLLLEVGFDGGGGGGPEANIVYVFLKSPSFERGRQTTQQQRHSTSARATPARKLVRGGNSDLFKL